MVTSAVDPRRVLAKIEYSAIAKRCAPPDPSPQPHHWRLHPRSMHSSRGVIAGIEPLPRARYGCCVQFWRGPGKSARSRSCASVRSTASARVVHVSANEDCCVSCGLADSVMIDRDDNRGSIGTACGPTTRRRVLARRISRSGRKPSRHRGPHILHASAAKKGARGAKARGIRSRTVLVRRRRFMEQDGYRR